MNQYNQTDEEEDNERFVNAADKELFLHYLCIRFEEVLLGRKLWHGWLSIKDVNSF